MNKFITSKTVLCKNEKQGLNTLHIALCFDDKYSVPGCITAFSIIKNNTDINLVFHLFTLNVKNTSLNRFKRLSDDNVTLFNYDISTSFINELTKDLDTHTDNYWYLNKIRLSSACLRLIISDVLYTTTKKILYIDCDTLCLNSLSDLIDLDISDYYSACIEDNDVKCHSTMLFGTPDEKYFNSGVMLINTEKWVNESLTAKAISMLIQNNGKFTWPDQDVLNILMKGNVYYLSVKYNFMPQPKDKIPDGTIIAHFAANPKPWFKVRNEKTYLAYLLSSPCKDITLKTYDKETSNRYVLKTYAEDLRAEGKYLMSFIYYLRYKLQKLSPKK
ncbi:glycosyltransferase family 8 protein [Affinibrenneria salicis]|uniref:Glycosyltransferase family 8 protein n=1 Tax=Affinibrenneria salicis TaxID=2590031 RepID=A0A5J5FUS4_9GAMM|nr:glycosyltransferase family 8 protein [Affinibrenneria salicis]KAA8997305.1 glycosyltransferase family 8 protein [Affinibrenneria salicis]